MNDTDIEGRTLVVRDELLEWEKETQPALTFDGDGFKAAILPGSYFDIGEVGVTLIYRDPVVTWAEYYTDLPTAMARLAAWQRARERHEMFRDDPYGFIRWSEQFFDRTTTATPRGRASN